MNALFRQRGCPFCDVCEEAILKLNRQLPLHQERIQIIDIYSGDTRCHFLSSLFQTPNPLEWSTPVVVLDTPYLKQELNSLKIKNHRFILFSGAFVMLNYGVMKRLMPHM